MQRMCSAHSTAFMNYLMVRDNQYRNFAKKNRLHCTGARTAHYGSVCTYSLNNRHRASTTNGSCAARPASGSLSGCGGPGSLCGRICSLPKAVRPWPARRCNHSAAVRVAELTRKFPPASSNNNGDSVSPAPAAAAKNKTANPTITARRHRRRGRACSGAGVQVARWRPGGKGRGAAAETLAGSRRPVGRRPGRPSRPRPRRSRAVAGPGKSGANCVSP
jgi:hypothetical protein